MYKCAEAAGTAAGTPSSYGVGHGFEATSFTLLGALSFYQSSRKLITGERYGSFTIIILVCHILIVTKKRTGLFYPMAL